MLIDIECMLLLLWYMNVLNYVYLKNHLIIRVYKQSKPVIV